MPIGVYNLYIKQASREEHTATTIPQPACVFLDHSNFVDHLTPDLWLHLDHLLPGSLARTSRSTCSPPSFAS
jgi:hypothetical protein